MNSTLERLLDRPMSHKIGAWVGVLAFITFIFWTYFYKDNLLKKEELGNKITSLTADIGHERRLAQNLPKFREEVKDLDNKLQSALKELPDKREIPDLLASVSGLAKGAGLEVSLFRPLPENSKEFYVEVPVGVAVEGTFHQVVTFFDEVGRLSRIVNINQLGFRDPVITDEKVIVKADCLATTFRYLDESERISSPQEADSKKRRRR